jgi:hypothetical protein
MGRFGGSHRWCKGNHKQKRRENLGDDLSIELHQRIRSYLKGLDAFLATGEVIGEVPKEG